MNRVLTRRPSAAMVVSLVALFVALSGTAIAASGLVNGDKLIKKTSLSGNRLRKHTITGTQVNLKQLGKVPSATKADSATNATRAGSADTATNATHATVADSAPLPKTLPSGESLTGTYGLIDNATAASQRAGTAISFEIPLATAPTTHFIKAGTTPPSACPGTAAAPKAAPGNLCIYEATAANVKLQSFEDPVTSSTGSTVQPFGAEVVALSAAAGNLDDSGSWAVTAP